MNVFSIPLIKYFHVFKINNLTFKLQEEKTDLPSKRVAPEVIEDFLCNFLMRMGMTRTLDCFQSEW